MLLLKGTTTETILCISRASLVSFSMLFGESIPLPCGGCAFHGVAADHSFIVASEAGGSSSSFGLVMRIVFQVSCRLHVLREPADTLAVALAHDDGAHEDLDRTDALERNLALASCRVYSSAYQASNPRTLTHVSKETY